jgi:tetratricopeptide (TPR) repeat protein
MLIGGCGIWNSFTTYFNTYYNARTIFDETEQQVLENRKDIFEFKDKELPKNLYEKFTKVIEKSSKILQFDAESSFFDDALLLAGKSFYYQQEFVKAERKFKELSGVKDSDLLLQNKYWYAKTELQLRNFDRGLELLDELKKTAVEEDDDNLLKEAFITEVGFYIYRENYSDAVASCKKLLEISDDDKLNAQTAFELGKIYQMLEDDGNAAKSFAEVMEYSPTSEVELKSKIENAKLLRKLGNYDQSMEILNELNDENKFSDSRDAIELQMGLIYKDRGEIDKALETLTVIDTTYKNTESVGQAELELGKIYENILGDYDSARVYYNKAMTSRLEMDQKEIARKKFQLFARYDEFQKSYNNYLTQIEYIVNPQSFIEDSLKYEEYLNRDTAQINFELRNIGQRNRNQTNQPSQLKPKPVPKPIKPTISVDSLQNLIVRNRYELANLFFSDLEVPDSAYYYYNNLIKDHPDSRYTPNIYYALGSYYLVKNNKEKADSLFNIIYENYPKSDIYVEAAKKLGKFVLSEKKDESEQLYLEAENNFYNGNIDTALIQFSNIAEQHPDSPLAPKALYTVGWILENSLDSLDSAAVVYDTLMTRYKNTPYARNIAPKLAFYQQDKEKKLRDQKQRADSLAADSLRNIKQPAEQTAEKTKPVEVVKDSSSTNVDTLKVSKEEKIEPPLTKQEQKRKDFNEREKEKVEELIKERLKKDSTKVDTTRSNIVKEKIPLKEEILKEEADSLNEKESVKDDSVNTNKPSPKELLKLETEALKDSTAVKDSL